MEKMTSCMWWALNRLCRGHELIDGRSGDALVRRGLAVQKYPLYEVTDKGRKVEAIRAQKPKMDMDYWRPATPDIAFLIAAEGISRDRSFAADWRTYRDLAEAAYRVASELSKRLEA